MCDNVLTAVNRTTNQSSLDTATVSEDSALNFATNSKRAKTSDRPHSDFDRQNAQLSSNDAGDEERRKFRNREYQRRFREKKMQIELQRLSKLTSASYTFWPHAHLDSRVHVWP